MNKDSQLNITVNLNSIFSLKKANSLYRKPVRRKYSEVINSVPLIRSINKYLHSNSSKASESCLLRVKVSWRVSIESTLSWLLQVKRRDSIHSIPSCKIVYFYCISFEVLRPNCSGVNWSRRTTVMLKLICALRSVIGLFEAVNKR